MIRDEERFVDEPDDLKMLQVAAGTPVPNYRDGPPFPLNAVVAIARLLPSCYWGCSSWVCGSAISRIYNPSSTSTGPRLFA